MAVTVLSIAVVLLVLSGYALLLGLRRTPTPPESGSESGPGLVARVRGWGRVLVGRFGRKRLVGAVVAGVAGLAVTQWPLMLVLGPLAVLGLPVVLGGPAAAELDRLHALERWVRGLATSLPIGCSIGDAVRISVSRTPPELRDQIQLMVLRMDARMPLHEAVRAFADEMATPEVDSVAAALILAARRGATGATATLKALADSLQDRLRVMREEETERAKPRIVVRQVTAITAVVLGVSLIVGRSFFAPYSTPLGQLILVVLIGLYVGSLLLMRRVVAARHRPRIIRRTTKHTPPHTRGVSPWPRSR